MEDEEEKKGNAENEKLSSEIMKMLADASEEVKMLLSDKEQ